MMATTRAIIHTAKTHMDDRCKRSSDYLTKQEGMWKLFEGLFVINTEITGSIVYKDTD
jgi:hypothetical protein